MRKSDNSQSFIDPNFLGRKHFRLNKFKTLLPLCLSTKEWDIDRSDEIVKVSNRDFLILF